MRSISNFPSKKRSQHSPVWGRPASSPAAVPSHSNGNDYSRSPKSPSWGRRSGSPVTVTASQRVSGSPMWYRRSQTNNTNANATARSQSLSPRLQHPLLVQKREVPRNSSTSASSSVTETRSLSSSPRMHRRTPSHDLCTIAEDRRISSNTLNKMAITTPAKQIARNPTLQYHPETAEQQRQRRHQQMRKKMRDPYNDDWDQPDETKFDCFDCWAYHKDKFLNQSWWFSSDRESGRIRSSNDKNKLWVKQKE